MSNKDIECVECKYFVRCPAAYSYNNAACLTIREPHGLTEDELSDKLDEALKLVREVLKENE